jgi:hypothetical protein
MDKESAASSELGLDLLNVSNAIWTGFVEYRRSGGNIDGSDNWPGDICFWLDNGIKRPSVVLKDFQTYNW